MIIREWKVLRKFKFDSRYGWIFHPIIIFQNALEVGDISLTIENQCLEQQKEELRNKTMLRVIKYFLLANVFFNLLITFVAVNQYTVINFQANNTHDFHEGDLR